MLSMELCWLSSNFEFQVHVFSEGFDAVFEIILYTGACMGFIFFDNSSTVQGRFDLLLSRRLGSSLPHLSLMSVGGSPA